MGEWGGRVVGNEDNFDLMLVNLPVDRLVPAKQDCRR